ncbi:MAG: hypothetical protein COA70_11920 [Planctomycetota bacterium]|nr:MAG: hypothetical protein COA70_11920 [Planctomycetota bacterium]
MTEGFQLSTSSARSGPETIFDSGGGSYFSTLTGTEEWVDEGAFARRGILPSEQINGFDYSYCSTLPDPVGDAITTEVRFYNDTIIGSGPSSYPTAECAYGIAGLPGDTSLGGISCWAIGINLEGGFECTLPQEATPGGGTTTFFGMGWMYLDAFGGGQTGPFVGGTGYGSQDSLELFDNTGHATFNFGGNPLANISVVLYGNGILDTSVVNADAPDIGDILALSSDVEFRTGAQVTWSLRDPATAGITYAMLVGTAGSSAGFGGLAGLGTNLLIDPGAILSPPTPLVMSGTPPSFTSPPLPPLPPVVMAQAFGFSGGIGVGNATQASNALVHNN